MWKVDLHKQSIVCRIIGRGDLINQCKGWPVNQQSGYAEALLFSNAQLFIPPLNHIQLALGAFQNRLKPHSNQNFMQM